MQRLTKIKKVILRIPFILLQISRKKAEKSGKITNVNKIFIEKIVGMGRTGKEYNPFPTK